MMSGATHRHSEPRRRRRIAEFHTRGVLAALALLIGLTTDISAQQRKETIDLAPIAIFDSHLYAGPFAEPRGIAFDRKNNEVWVADTRNGLIGVFTPEGFPLFTFGGSAELRDPIKLAVDPMGHLLVIAGDRSHIYKYSYRGQPLGELKLAGTGTKPIFGAMAFDREGNLYVGENVTGQVLVYDAALKLKQKFGSRGNEEGQFQSICGIAIDDDGAVYVADQQVLGVQVFDRHGDYLRGWGQHDMGLANVSLPSGIAVDSKGHVILVDMLRHEVKVFTKDGEFLDRFGSMGDAPGQTPFPADVAVDANDHIYVVARGNGRVTVFREDVLAAAKK